MGKTFIKILSRKKMIFVLFCKYKIIKNIIKNNHLTLIRVVFNIIFFWSETPFVVNSFKYWKVFLLKPGRQVCLEYLKQYYTNLEIHIWFFHSFDTSTLVKVAGNSLKLLSSLSSIGRLNPSLFSQLFKKYLKNHFLSRLI